MKKLLLTTLLIIFSLASINNTASASITGGQRFYYAVEIKDVYTNNEKQPVTDIEITMQFKGDEDNSHPYAVLVKRNVLVKPTTIETDAKGNQIVTFKISRLNPGESVALGEKLYFYGSTKNFKINSAKVNSDYSSFTQNSLYTEPSYHIESDNKLIADKAKIVVGQEVNPLLKAKKIYGFVNNYLKYDSKEFSNKGALYGLNSGKGVCYEYSALMVAMLRSTGVPARMIEGYKLEAKDIPKNPKLTDGRLNLSGDAHAWVEFYLPGVGWVPSEPTVEYTVNGRKKIAWDFFTNIVSPYYIPINIDINMESKWSSAGHLTVNRVETLDINPKDFSTPPEIPQVITNQESDKPAQSSDLSKQTRNIDFQSLFGWLKSTILPLTNHKNLFPLYSLPLYILAVISLISLLSRRKG